MAFLRPIQDSIHVMRNFESFDESYFDELNKISFEYDISSSLFLNPKNDTDYALYLDQINSKAYALYLKAKQICDKEIYFQSYPEGHAKVHGYATALLNSLAALNQFIRNNETYSYISDSNAFYCGCFKTKVEVFYDNLRRFCEEFSMMREEYQQYLRSLTKCAG